MTENSVLSQQKQTDDRIPCFAIPSEHDLSSAIVRLGGFIDLVESSASASIADLEELVQSARTAHKVLRNFHEAALPIVRRTQHESGELRKGVQTASERPTLEATGGTP